MKLLNKWNGAGFSPGSLITPGVRLPPAGTGGEDAKGSRADKLGSQTLRCILRWACHLCCWCLDQGGSRSEGEGHRKGLQWKKAGKYLEARDCFQPRISNLSCLGRVRVSGSNRGHAGSGAGLGMFGVIWTVLAGVSPGGNDSRKQPQSHVQGQVFSYGINVGRI